MTPVEQSAALAGVRAEIARLAETIAVPPTLLSTAIANDSYRVELDFYEAADGDDEDGWRYSLVYREHDVDFSLCEAEPESIDVLLYKLFSDLVSVMARHAPNAAEGPDGRVSWFSEQVRLLGQINPDWAARRAAYHQQVLAKHPSEEPIL